MNPKRYCIFTVATVGAALAAVAGFNLLVDPSGVFPRVHLQTFASLRGTIFNRVARAELVRRGDWDMVILGTSRAKAGLPASHPAFATNHVCNLSVDGARMSEAAAMFDYARARNPLRRVVLCLDFVLSRDATHDLLIDPSDFAESRFNPKLSLFDYHCKHLLGREATDGSFEFVRDHLRKKLPPEGERDGFHVRALRLGTSQRALFEKSFRALAYGYAAQRTSTAEMAAFRGLVASCRENNIELTLAINPVHALDLELLRAGGNWEQFEQWKRDVARIVAEEWPTARVPVWDFSGYGPATTEEVPAAGDTTARMKYYFENSHYTPALGAVMLDRMLGQTPGEFGVLISPANIEAHLQKIREQRETYAGAHAAEVQWVQRTARQVLDARNQSTGAAKANPDP